MIRGRFLCFGDFYRPVLYQPENFKLIKLPLMFVPLVNA